MQEFRLYEETADKRGKPLECGGQRASGRWAHDEGRLSAKQRRQIHQKSRGVRIEKPTRERAFQAESVNRTSGTASR